MPRAIPSRRWSLVPIALALVLVWTARPVAHEVPNEVTVYTFLKPEGDRLTLLVRVPMDALRDIEFPMWGPGYLDIPRAGQALEDAATLWISDFVGVYEGETRLDRPEVAAIRVSLPSERAFGSFGEAWAHLHGPPLPDNIQLYWEQGLLDVAFVYRIRSDQSEFGISPGLTRLGLRVNVVLRFLPPGGPERAFDVHGDPGIVWLDPRWHQAAWLFVREGFFHILDGADHLLFLLCLVIPFRRIGPLIVLVTSFTVAHSVTLIASAYGMAPDALWFPPLVETLIAISIVYMAFENIVGAGLERRWMVTFAFGLVHGFGFSFLLRDTLQFAGGHLVTSLVAFNLGVELGQLAVLAVAIPALGLLFRYVVNERMGTILLSALVAHQAWHWAAERGGDLALFPWPAFDAALVASLMRLAMLIVAAAGAVWLFASWLRQKGLIGEPRVERPAEVREPQSV